MHEDEPKFNKKWTSPAMRIQVEFIRFVSGSRVRAHNERDLFAERRHYVVIEAMFFDVVNVIYCATHGHVNVRIRALRQHRGQRTHIYSDLLCDVIR